MRSSTAHRVVTVLAPGANPFEFAVSCEVFGLRRPELDVEWYDHRLAATVDPLVVKGGWTVSTPFGLESLATADTVVIPACPQEVPRELTEALRAAYERGARMVSFCSGAYALAAAGILDGRPATTHWMHANDLAERYPRIQVDPSVLYVDNGQVLTSAGTAGGIDLALHIVRLDHGPQIANQVAQRMVVPPQRDGGQAQFAISPVPESPHDNAIGPVLEWMQDNLHEPVSVPHLARMAAMSPRTFARRFSEVTGTTPGRWLTHQRTVRAQELLSSTDLPVDVVADRAGFGTAANLRDHLRRQTGKSPSAFRNRTRLVAS